jgi:DNA modification methylase
VSEANKMGLADHLVYKGKETGISTKSLKTSRNFRKNFVLQFGVVPESILVADGSDKAMDSYIDGRGGAYMPERHILHKKHGKKMAQNTGMESVQAELLVSKTGFGLRSLKSAKIPDEAKSLSRFAQNVGRIIVEFYCPNPGIVLDLFAGHNSRMELCYKLGRDYIGVDISHNFMVANRRIRQKLYKENNASLFPKANTITLIEGSSSKVDLPDDYADFTITSPPYWDLEWYGDEAEQLSTSLTYQEFLDRISVHAQENFRILKPGSFCAWFINDFRKNNVFYPYHIDTYNFLIKAGFEPFQIYIVDLGKSLGQIFLKSIISQKIFPKRHEFCVIVKKPE